MKKGDPIDARPVGSKTWVRCQIDLVSGNRKSLALSTAEGLPLVALDKRTGRQVLLLILRDGGGYICLHTGLRYELRVVES